MLEGLSQILNNLFIIMCFLFSRAGCVARDAGNVHTQQQISEKRDFT